MEKDKSLTGFRCYEMTSVLRRKQGTDYRYSGAMYKKQSFKAVSKDTILSMQRQEAEDLIRAKIAYMVKGGLITKKKS